MSQKNKKIKILHLSVLVSLFWKTIWAGSVSLSTHVCFPGTFYRLTATYVTLGCNMWVNVLRVINIYLCLNNQLKCVRLAAKLTATANM